MNPDFAETEADARQINLTRFPLFFPEKRAFFLEGSNLFRFGLGLTDDFIPFYSRRIGLFEEEIVPLAGGLKIVGQAGRWGIAALDVETRSRKRRAAHEPLRRPRHLRCGRPSSARGDRDERRSVGHGREHARGSRRGLAHVAVPGRQEPVRRGLERALVRRRRRRATDRLRLEGRLSQRPLGRRPALRRLRRLPRPGARIPSAARDAAVRPLRRVSAEAAGRALRLGPPVLLRDRAAARHRSQRRHGDVARLHGALQRPHPVGRAPRSQLGAGVRAPRSTLRDLAAAS